MLLKIRIPVKSEPHNPENSFVYPLEHINCCNKVSIELKKPTAPPIVRTTTTYGPLVRRHFKLVKMKKISLNMNVMEVRTCERVV